MIVTKRGTLNLPVNNFILPLSTCLGKIMEMITTIKMLNNAKNKKTKKPLNCCGGMGCVFHCCLFVRRAEQKSSLMQHLPLLLLQTGCVQLVSSTRTAQRGMMASCLEGVWPASTPVSPTCSTSPARHMSPAWLDVPALLGE